MPLAVALAGALLVGILTALQSRINGELALRIGDGYVAALISFGSGLVLLLSILVFWAPGRHGLRRVVEAVWRRRIPWWYVCGGMAGAFFVLSQGLTAGILGVALFTIAFVCGQTISGLVVDRVGMGTMAPVAITVTRLAGSLLALAAVVWSVSAQLSADIPFWVILLPFLAGIGLGWQQAANGQVRVVAQSAMTATLINFIAGTTVLAVAAAVHVGIVGAPTRFPSEIGLYTGGVLGAGFIGLAIVVVKRSGVLLLGLGGIAGQLATALVLDIAAPVAEHPISAPTVIGTVLTLIAVAIAASPSARLGGGREPKVLPSEPRG